VTVKALACDRPTDERRRPLSRFSVEDVRLRAEERGLSMSLNVPDLECPVRGLTRHKASIETECL
jgi:hypothetical protein